MKQFFLFIMTFVVVLNSSAVIRTYIPISDEILYETPTDEYICLPQEYEDIEEEWYNLSQNEQFDLCITAIRDLHYMILDSGSDWLQVAPESIDNSLDFEQSEEDVSFYIYIENNKICTNNHRLSFYDFVILLHNTSVVEDYTSDDLWF